MNKLCYRIIFNKVRGMLMVVPEIARSGYGHAARRRQRATRKEAQVRINPLSFALWLAAGAVALPAQANIVADSSAPGNQQPTVMSTANGLPQINIQTPNGQGVSRNKYSQLDVDGRGVILNNSHQNTRTQLGGMVAANPWLSKQEASVILNEVNSRNPSQLNGFIEVAGKRAAVVIANPSGITCNGCGFINASRNTLTTGQAVMENGQLKGFDVNGGRVNIEGKGLQDSDADYTQIIAQSVTVNAKLHARDLNVVTGKNQVSADGGVTAVKASDEATRPAFALDVAAIGGMYANKITLTGTEKGVGVRNAGELGASAGELKLSVDGKLENSGTLQSSDALQIASKSDQNNSGKILSQQTVTLSADGTLRNSGLVSAGSNATLSANRIESTSEGTLAAGVDGSGALTQSGNLSLTSQGELRAQGKNLAHDQIQAQGSRVDFSGSQTSADSIGLASTQDDVSTAGATLSARAVQIGAATKLNNDEGKLSAGSLSVTAKNISNNRGLLRQQNQQSLALNTGALLNNQGTIVNEGDTVIKADSIDNRSGLIAGNGSNLTLDARQLENQQGTLQLAGNDKLKLNIAQLDGNQGSVLSAGALEITGSDLDLSQGHTQAQALTLKSDTLNNQQGILSQRGEGEMALDVAGAMANQDGRIESGGNLRIASGSLDNSRGTLLAAGQGDLQVSANEVLNNTQGSMLAGHNLNLSASSLKNERGVISATGGEARLTTRQRIDNAKGRIEAQQQLTTQSLGLDNQGGTLLGKQLSVATQAGELNNASGNIVAQTALNLDSGNLKNDAGLIQSGQALAINTHGAALTNTDSGKAGIISGGTLTIASGDTDNSRGVIAAASDSNITSGALVNADGVLMSDRALSLDTGATDNQRGLLQAGDEFSLDTHGASLINSDSGERGGIVARGDLQLATGEIDGGKGFIQARNIAINTHQQDFQHQGGILSSSGTLLLETGELNNQAGRIQSGSDMQLASGALDNQQSAQTGGIIAGGDLLLNSGDTDNSTGAIVAAGDANINSGVLTNNHGTLAADKTLKLITNAVENQHGLLQAGDALSLDTQGAQLTNSDSGTTGGIIAGGDLLLSTGQINGGSGVILGQNVTVDTHQQTFDHQLGQLGARGVLQLDSGELNNRAGRIEAAGDLLLDTHGNSLNNSDSGTAGGLFSGGKLRLRSGNLNNQKGDLTGKAGTDIVAGDVNNQDGVLNGGSGLLSLLSGKVENQGGLLQAGTDLLLDTQGQQLVNTGSGSQRGIVAMHDLDIRSGATDNHTGFIAAGNQATLHTGELNNSQGQIAGNGGLAYSGQALNNDDGKLQSAGDITIDTAGRTLSNQRGLIAGSKNTRIASGELDNQQGQIQGGKDLNLGANGLQNQNGKLFSAGTLTLQAGQLNNQSGQLQSVDNASLVLTQKLDNTGGLIHGSQALDIVTPRLINQNSKQNNKGIEGGTLTLQIDTLDNSKGALRASNLLSLTVRQALENLNGLISSANTLIVQDAAQGQALAIDNRKGTLIADSQAQISAASLSGDGQVLSQGDLDITLAGDFQNASEVKANGTLRLTTGGNLTNDGTIGAQQALWLSAQNITNNKKGEISAQETHIAAADTLTNTGLIDGGLTHLTANVLNNIGTGRIYGDRIAIAATVLNNLSDKGKAAVIAARERLDVGADTINNRDHALIYSDGDMHFGRQLDASYHAIGQARQLNNDGATIEAGRDATIAVSEVNNTNRNLTTKIVTTENAQHHDAVLKGHTDRFDWADVDTSHKNKYNVHSARMPDGTSGSEFYEYTYQRVVKETQIKSSDPGKILSGGNMTFTANRLTNQDSQIVAGAALGGQIGELDNEATKGTRVTTDKGKSVRWYAKKKKKKLGGTKTSQGKSSSNYAPAPVTETIDLQTLTWQANAAPQGSGYQTNGLQQQAVTAQAGTVGAIKGQQAKTAVTLGSVASGDMLLPAGERYDSTLTLDKLSDVKNNPLLLPNGQQFSLTLPSTVVDGQTITPVIRAVSPDTRLPDNSLYQLQPASDSRYLVETDPRFVNQKQWLGSDYMQNALTTDGSQILKRLGDGYYEQRLVRDQVTQLTGGRYISGYGSDEDQYRGLMNNGIAFGKEYQLTLGVALTPAQMALLTSDIVWLVNQTVTLPDGTQQTVLVPQVYAKVKEGDLTGDGALLGGGSVAINAQKDITNSGTILGREVTQLTAQSLTNSGYIDGNEVSLTARQDINNLGGTISGDKSVSLLAGHDITSQSTLRSDGTDRWVDRPAGIYVQGSDGTLALSALNNITLAASDIGNAGANGTTRIQAGKDLTLGTVTTQHSENDSWGSDNYRRLSQQTDVGTRINAAGSLTLSAGQDIKASAADVTAGGALTASAGRDIMLNAGNDRSDLVEHSKQSSKGLLSGSSLETHDEVHNQQALSTTFSGDSVQLQAGRDIAVTGSNVAGTQDVALSAGRDLNVTTAGESSQEIHQREEKKSGLMGTGGIGFTVGQAMQKSTTDASGSLNKGSTIGSSDGNVTLSANNQLNVHGSDVIAGKDLTLSGSDVAITAAENSHTSLTKTEQKQSGLTLALSGTVGSALNTATQVAHTAAETGDGRMKALQATKAALSVQQAEQAYEMDGAQTAAANAHNEALGLKPGDEGYQKGSTDTVGVNLSYGSQSSKSETRSESRQAQGSSLGAGGNLNITATGAQAASQGDITVQGSQLNASGDMALTAKNDINLLSAQNSERTDSTNSSKGGSIGVGLTAGSGGTGFNVSASVNAGKGRENGNGVTHTETTLNAGNALSLNAGRDTLLQGAQVSGNSVKVDTGRNLTLTSEQDSDRYDSKQQSASAGASYTFGGGGGSVSVNLSRDKMHSTWQSVNEQTGIFAGKGGFDVTVGEHTQLNGAVIGSTADASLNKLDTGTLGFSNIENHADYKVEHQSVGMSSGGPIGSQMLGNMA
ncbi:hemagglutinin repeat-containing protein, partial [Kalamiella sp. sgz302252]|uniref:hemagglutinin repeat-containing protein n=1 Tax=Pantoea sp. sgz302252 TaxID=3341827 RepID=UPI0036D25791